MTVEERLAKAEEALALERAKVRELERVIALQANALSEHATREAAAAAKREARSRVNRQNYERRKSDRAQTSESGLNQTLNSLPPPFPSPSLSAPISPPPLSSPNPLFSAVSQSEPAAQPLLVVVDPTPPPTEKPKRPGRSNALGEFIDWAKAETRKHLAPDAPDNCTLAAHQAAKLGEAVKLHGLEALRAAFRLWMGWTVAQEKGYPLGMFSSGWETWVGQVKAQRGGPSEATPPRKMMVL